MRILITGASGFVGQHLAHYLEQTIPEAELHGTTLSHSKDYTIDSLKFHTLDLKDTKRVQDLINEVQPDHIYHLAAQAFVPRSFEAPWETLENNILGQLNILQACMNAEIKPRMLVVSSAEIYGLVKPTELPITEQTELRPTSPYSVSKVTQDMLAFQYATSYGFPVMRARSFNHIGPGQSENFVAPAFGLQIARIENGLQEPVLHVGDLSAQRDFTDVRDIVHAYHLIVEHGQPGDVFNVASGKARSIRSLLDGLLAQTSADIRVEIDQSRLRPTQIPILQGSCTHLNQVTGWEPEIPFEQSLADIMANCRQRVQDEISM